MEAVEYEMLKNIVISSAKKYEKWLLMSRRLFNEEAPRNNARDDGFVSMNYDLFDDLATGWHSRELMTPRQKQYLSEEIIVTNDNVGFAYMYNSYPPAPPPMHRWRGISGEWYWFSVLGIDAIWDADGIVYILTRSRPDGYF